MQAKAAVLIFGAFTGYALALSDFLIATLSLMVAGLFFATEYFFGEEENV